ncbi:carbonic anhydrase [Calditerrivibrio nitroreducens]|uniref:Carbonic anhydrase n=1 Tax=Calditerrivibrio nitroreducens (strain DSM 19672 / NBRC 101217 / Yu37-1) TaxID=768670 RepID=E4TGP9_CALNY|nr:carbonic anhydrase [Calditerrivibrio nitroreducens]ADR19762.1 Carbonate dehydratase [Calditerrivibrio nitroreducens DSM 19672]
MEKLILGVLNFQEEEFLKHKEIFEKLKDLQTPHTLFIGCSDSRVVPTLITNSKPGELFIIRNIANVVPKYRDSNEVLATTSAIEYAVQVLGVETIVVCGHSNCGGCKAARNPENLEGLPHVQKWVTELKPVENLVKKLMNDINSTDDAQEEWLFEQANVVYQMQNLLTYPYISEKYKKGKLHILGWYYIIETGEVYSYNPLKLVFEKIQ